MTIALERLLRGGRATTAGTLTFAARQGRTSRRFPGRIRGHALRPGAYRARIRAVSADGLRSRQVSLRFRVLR